ncbi:MAG: class B sortase [Lachnospiraceae bacterium]|jgi:sortase B|nr:class B sortase [Lachnospiraceae bacterium]
MNQGNYRLDGREFRTALDFAKAKRDKQLIDSIRQRIDFRDQKQVEQLAAYLTKNQNRFQSILGEEFLQEVTRKCAELQAGKGRKEKNAGLDLAVRKELHKRERMRRILITLCSLLAVFCLGYFGLYTYYDQRTQKTYEELSDLREADNHSPMQTSPTTVGSSFSLEAKETPPVLEEYKKLLNTNKKLIGWLKIDDTNIDYPVMQTINNEYYLEHNINQEYDKNGSIFMDTACDVMKPSTNFIIYGHNMKSGQMFGKLDLYSSEKYYQEHPVIQFDTIYEKGTYEIMYVFRSHVYKENEVTFKYYQFIDALSETEFDSYMEEMSNLSLYETNVTAKYTDQLLTLSTCDNYVDDGRFVVVAKKVNE